MAPRTSTLIAKRSRALRKAMTEPEIMLWSRLKGRGTDKPIFRRQVGYQSIIFDFYCPAARLAVEIDGSTPLDRDKRGTGINGRRTRRGTFGSAAAALACSGFLPPMSTET
jgi:very-short-patch-repair endonuclease